MPSHKQPLASKQLEIMHYVRMQKIANNLSKTKPLNRSGILNAENKAHGF